jgi:hypothetical protein
MEAQGFVSKFQQMGKACRSDPFGMGLSGIMVVPDKTLKLRSISPCRSVTLLPDYAGYTATPEVSLPVLCLCGLSEKSLQTGLAPLVELG